MLPVIVQHRIIQRVDPLEVIGIEHVLRTRPRGRSRAEIRVEQARDRLQDRKTRRSAFSAGFFQPIYQSLIDEREENDARRRSDLRDNLVELDLRAHQRIDVLDRGHALILRRHGAADRDERLAGRVGYKMQMEIAAAQQALPIRPWRCGQDPGRGGRRRRPVRSLARPGMMINSFDSRAAYRAAFVICGDGASASRQEHKARRQIPVLPAMHAVERTHAFGMRGVQTVWGFLNNALCGPQSQNRISIQKKIWF